MYKCNSCGHEFSRPRTIDGDGDEQYDVCPKCESGDFEDSEETKDNYPEAMRIVASCEGNSSQLIRTVAHLITAQ